MFMLSRGVYAGLRASGLTGAARRLRHGGLILGYHNVVPAPQPSGGDRGLHLPLPRFARQVEWLARRYEILPLPELLARQRAGHAGDGTAALSFDDAYAGVLTEAWPWLRARGIPATVFVVADAADAPAPFWWDLPEVAATDGAARDRWLDEFRGDGEAIRQQLPEPRAAPHLDPSQLPAGWDALARAVAEGLGIGVHSATHRSLPTLDDEALVAETAGARARIHARLGVPAGIFAYPYGRWDARVRAAVLAAGFSAALTLTPGLNDARTDRWSLRRVNVPAGVSDAAFEGRAAGLIPPGRT